MPSAKYDLKDAFESLSKYIEYRDNFLRKQKERLGENPDNPETDGECSPGEVQEQPYRT